MTIISHLRRRKRRKNDKEDSKQALVVAADVNANDTPDSAGHFDSPDNEPIQLSKQKLIETSVAPGSRNTSLMARAVETVCRKVVRGDDVEIFTVSPTFAPRVNGGNVSPRQVINQFPSTTAWDQAFPPN